MCNFKFENDDFFWEMLQLQEIGLPESWNFIIPDKLFHFLTVFFIAWFLRKWFKPIIAVSISWFLMLGPWEILWDGCYRLGFSYKDVIANFLGGLVAYWWLKNPKVGQL